MSLCELGAWLGWDRVGGAQRNWIVRIVQIVLLHRDTVDTTLYLHNTGLSFHAGTGAPEPAGGMSPVSSFQVFGTARTWAGWKLLAGAGEKQQPILKNLSRIANNAKTQLDRHGRNVKLNIYGSKISSK